MKLNPKSPANRLFGFPPGTYSIKTWNERLGAGQHEVFTTLLETKQYLIGLGFQVGLPFQEVLERNGEAILDAPSGWVASVIYCRPGR